ncbi:glutathione S-transferase family protein [Mesorhizobium sp. DCY119]|uniref:glutathione S-transferase family protein n=1 Tax=Mesorhizobium sp. DCY119 TaxID=2108445 RepID=UPI000E6C505F|nr:glutathione S-transferase family protein [Mesorhizobium sp. DCY119]RJG44443.1 glutathione S-transferase family protein [Mesorhizobium sp. DCY119]
MKLLWSPKSPFVRKVMIVIHELGLVDRIELVRAVAMPRGEPNPVILKENPLGKIPTLLVPGLPPIFDSAVICDWLSQLSADGESLIPRAGKPRLRQLRWQALGDGLTENLLLWRIECLGADGGDAEMIASYRAKVRAALAVLEDEAGDLASTPFGIGQIAILCALGQLDFRYSQSRWRGAHPKLTAWSELQADRPSVAATVIVNDQGADEGPIMNLTFGED